MYWTLPALCALGFAFVVAAWLDRKRVREDREIIAGWYREVVSMLADAEKQADIARAAACRATNATKLQTSNLPSTSTADCHP